MAGSVLAATLVLGAVHPAAAHHLGSGVASGTEDQLDAGDPPVQGTIDAVGTTPIPACARAQDNDYVDPVTGTDSDNLSAKYTLNSPDGTFSFSSGQVTGITVTVETTKTFYFGPQGTHYDKTLLGNDCGADNLGRLSPVPAKITVTSGSLSCSTVTETGNFWREGGDEFGVEATFSAGGDCVASTLAFNGIFQPPCGFLVDCINGAYTQH